jgi:hypothetical protein
MAILKNTTLVNNGNTGWSRTNVLDALEEAIGDLGWHSGSQTNGIVTTCHAPGRTGIPYLYELTEGSSWNQCGGLGLSPRIELNQRYMVTVNSGAYKFQRFYRGQSYTSDYITFDTFHDLENGHALVYRAVNSQVTALSPSISDGDTVYLVKYSATDYQSIRLATSLADATAEEPVYLTDFNQIGPSEFVLMDATHTDTTQLQEVRQGDYISFETPTNFDTVRGSDSLLSSSHPLYIQDSSGAYDADRLINTVNYKDIYADAVDQVNSRNYPSNGNLAGSGWDGSGIFYWNTSAWEQGNYYIVCGNHSTMTVTLPLVVSPGRMDAWSSSFFKSVVYPNREGLQMPYYDYTVPASGDRSALSLRIYRDHNNIPSKISGVRVMNMNSSGWTTDEVFTIPGTAIGGASPEDDIVFGVNATESSSGAGDGTPSIRIWNKGAGVNSYWKDAEGSRLLWRCENDATKTYGVTYWLFQLTSDYQIRFKTGINPWFDNLQASGTTDSNYGPRFGGNDALDFQELNNRMDANSFMERSFATSSTPTAYPLKIVTYKAQSPQDDDFAIFQFVQTINGNDIPYLTWFHHKGNNYGNGVWDLDHVWQGGMTEIYGTNNTIEFQTSNCQRYNEERVDNDSYHRRTMREALFGYLRTTTTSEDYSRIRYNVTHNFFRADVAHDNTVIPYFRQNTYDDVAYDQNAYYNKNINDPITPGSDDAFVGGSQEVSSTVNFYKPIKGLPLSINIAPIPYYLPDDFVVIPFDITPGQADIRVGDIITISASEVYEVIHYSYTQLDESYDNINDNRTIGVVFAARTT